MYTPEFFNDKRVILTNGTRTILSKAQLNEFDEIIAYTDIPNPMHKDLCLWIIVEKQVTHILKFDGYSFQYRHKKTNETLMLPYDIDIDRKDEYDLIGNFDVFEKVPIIFDLFERYELIPKVLQDIFDHYEAENGLDYPQLAQMLKECEAVGYTFDYGLDAEPFNLQKILNF